MLKEPDSVKLERDAAERVQDLLKDVPFLRLEGIDEQPGWQDSDFRPDFLVRVKAHGRSYNLICEVKSSGQPRFVGPAVAQLRYYIQSRRNSFGIFVAPYVSSASQKICRDEEVGFVDLEGNCQIVFDGVFIERLVAERPQAERRELKSLFAPKSAQVLRLLLRDPRHPWKVADLAASAGVSLGHASNVRAALLDREWAEARPDGLILVNPSALLDSWREAYKRPRGKRLNFYTTLHGSALQEQARAALQVANEQGNAMLGSFSAAQWLAPFARVGTNYFYADPKGTAALEDSLRLSSASKGENIVIVELDDNGLFHDAVEPAPGIRCTSPVQTYLDLWSAGERGREAADHLRAEKLPWTTS